MVQKCGNFVDLEKYYDMSSYLQKSTLIQLSTGPPKFDVCSFAHPRFRDTAIEYIRVPMHRPGHDDRREEPKDGRQEEHVPELLKDDGLGDHEGDARGKGRQG